MILASLSDYLPLGDLWRIVIACLVVAVIAPSAVSVSVVGLDRRALAVQEHRSTAVGDLLVGVGVIVLAALIAFGIYALVEH